MNHNQPAKWFRMYAEFLHDPKVRMMSEQHQLRFIMLMCIRCSNGDVTLQDEEVAFQLRLSDEDWLSTKQVLLSKCLITADNKPTSWEKRQFASDSSAERVARHRAAKKNTANADVTLQSRQVETETETEKENLKPLRKSLAQNSQQATAFAEFWNAYPKKRNKGDAQKAWAKISADLYETILAAVRKASSSVDWTKDGGKYIPYPASWLRAQGWDDDVDVPVYSSEALAVMQAYNNTLASRGWPEATDTPFSQDRGAAIQAFSTFSDKPGFVSKYFSIVAETMRPKPGCGFDWLIRRETFLKVKEDVYGVAA